jgi:hypothetical protein
MTLYNVTHSTIQARREFMPYTYCACELKHREGWDDYGVVT